MNYLIFDKIVLNRTFFANEIRYPDSCLIKLENMKIIFGAFFLGEILIKYACVAWSRT